MRRYTVCFMNDDSDEIQATDITSSDAEEAEELFVEDYVQTGRVDANTTWWPVEVHDFYGRIIL